MGFRCSGASGEERSNRIAAPERAFATASSSERPAEIGFTREDSSDLFLFSVASHRIATAMERTARAIVAN